MDNYEAAFKALTTALLLHESWTRKEEIEIKFEVGNVGELIKAMKDIE